MKLIKFLNICAIFLLANSFVLFFLLLFGLYNLGEDVIFQGIKVGMLSIFYMLPISIVNLLYFVYAKIRRKATKLSRYILCELIMTVVPIIIMCILPYIPYE